MFTKCCFLLEWMDLNSQSKNCIEGSNQRGDVFFGYWIVEWIIRLRTTYAWYSAGQMIVQLFIRLDWRLFHQHGELQMVPVLPKRRPVRFYIHLYFSAYLISYFTQEDYLQIGSTQVVFDLSNCVRKELRQTDVYILLNGHVLRFINIQFNLPL